MLTLNLHKKYGPTFEMRAVSSAQMQTANSENVQAILPSSFNDFGVGPVSFVS